MRLVRYGTQQSADTDTIQRTAGETGFVSARGLRRTVAIETESRIRTPNLQAVIDA